MNMNKIATITLILLLLALAAYGQQQEKVAILNTVVDDDDVSIKFSDLNYLTTRFREIAVNVLPKSRYSVMSIQSIIAFLGSEEQAVKVCKENCLAQLGRKVSADYVAQARIMRFDNNFTIGVELYNSKSGALVGSFTGDSKNLQGLRNIIDEKAPILFKQMLGNENKEIKYNEKAEYVPNTQKTQAENILTDTRDGKKYKIVTIGEQTWMAENLNYEVKSFFGIFSVDTKCYDNNPSYCNRYGRLYNWSSAKDACPKGWHLPSNTEWQELVDFARQLAGRKLKAKKGWNRDGNGTDAYGFSALPGGYGGSDGVISGFGYAGSYGAWWSSSETNILKAYNWLIRYDDENAKPNPYNSNKDHLLSVRCLQD